MPATIVPFARRNGKTALMWHLLRQEAARRGLPIECLECQRPHTVPPPLGKCPCGGYVFVVGRRAGQLPLELPSDFHGGEQ
jgi:hypothetical protein